MYLALKTTVDSWQNDAKLSYKVMLMSDLHSFAVVGKANMGYIYELTFLDFQTSCKISRTYRSREMAKLLKGYATSFC